MSSTPVNDSVVEAVVDRLRTRSDVGQRKYGTTLDRKDLTFEQWLDHAIEEGLDLVNYLTRLKREAHRRTALVQVVRLFQDSLACREDPALRAGFRQRWGVPEHESLQMFCERKVEEALEGEA